MATNFFFRNTDYNPEQNLVSDLVQEMIKINGTDVYYIIRNTGTVDTLLTEATNSSFNIAIPMEMYINSYSGFQGEGDLLTKFGLSIADKLVLSVSRSRFMEDIGSVWNLTRPNEGDLVFFPFTKGIFEIKFVEHEDSFYPVGSLQYYELQLEKFNYNSETFNTGVSEIDQVMGTYSVAENAFFYYTEDGYYMTTEDNYELTLEDYDMSGDDAEAQNDIFQNNSDLFTDFTVQDPFSEGGVF
jgi:hypothetical protein